jgi:hypothetical protein
MDKRSSLFVPLSVTEEKSFYALNNRSLPRTKLSSTIGNLFWLVHDAQHLKTSQLKKY